MGRWDCIRHTDAGHKPSQIRNTRLICSQAYLTIMAAAGTDANTGLPGVGSTSRIRQPHAIVCQQVLVSSLPRADFDLQKSKWASRGWTYQEGKLSRRRLIFPERQVYFECLLMHASESLHTQFWFQHLECNLWSSAMLPRGTLWTSVSLGHPCHPRNFSPRPRSQDLFCITLSQTRICLSERRQNFPSWAWAGWKGRASIELPTEGWHTLAYDITIKIELACGRLMEWDVYFRSVNEKPLAIEHLYIDAWVMPIRSIVRICLPLEVPVHGYVHFSDEMLDWSFLFYGNMSNENAEWLFSTDLQGLFFRKASETLWFEHLLVLEPGGNFYEVIGRGSFSPKAGHGNGKHASWSQFPLIKKTMRIG